ncbi:hypothetical protein [Cohnella hashimotonis]|uniref:Uncharacterized protein n=1 Tax=Cohnella hashimotonis TaxID=2826895 RepID=A0ABT6TV29_9BACL|nr:hypothetical protein [Cohnella hashimotonis]MDI4649794.1 hypothetical protein [Cohnella hashimotonis]
MRDHKGRGDRDCEGGHKGRHHHGAKTFRRGRALEFWQMLDVKRKTLRQQLEAPEYREIKTILLGELKAIEQIIDEYTRHFELHRTEEEADSPGESSGDSPTEPTAQETEEGGA